MKHKNFRVLFFKTILFALSLLAGDFAATAQIFSATLSGPNESPANASPGLGTATITITGNNMRVQCTFSGLVGTTTASHIHAATAVAGTGTAGVATTTPSFSGFPLGVTSGTYDMTLDMTLASSFNPSYITANGGTATSAWSSLQAAIASGKAYFNIHTSSFPGGEIRGFFVTGPLAINLLQFDAVVNNSNSVFLNWKIAQAEPRTFFIVQKSIDGINFNDINTQISNDIQFQFDFTDKNLSNGNYFYRLKIIDNQGAIKYSNITLVKLKINPLLINLSPNPATTSIAINIDDATLINSAIFIYNAKMQLVQQQVLNSNYQKINVTDFSTGIYFIQFANGTVQKFIKQ